MVRSTTASLSDTKQLSRSADYSTLVEHMWTTLKVMVPIATRFVLHTQPQDLCTNLRHLATLIRSSHFLGP